MFVRLAPSEIEDCLCIYKDELLSGARDNFRRSVGCAVPRRHAADSSTINLCVLVSRIFLLL